MVFKVCGEFGGPFGLDILRPDNLMVYDIYEEGQHQTITNCSAIEQGSTNQKKWDETTRPDQPSNTSSHHTWRGTAALTLNKPRSKNCRHITGIGAHIRRMVDCLNAGYWICTVFGRSPYPPDARFPNYVHANRCAILLNLGVRSEKIFIGMFTPSSVVALALGRTD